MATTATVYPIPQFYFAIQWGGARIGFTECAGLDIANDVIEYREGTDNTFSKLKMPGLKKFGNVTLKRGLNAGDADFVTWITATVGNVPNRRTIVINLLDDTGTPQFSWSLNACWPVSYKFSELGSTKNEVAIETLELAHEGITLVQPS